MDADASVEADAPTNMETLVATVDSRQMWTVPSGRLVEPDLDRMLGTNVAVAVPMPLVNIPHPRLMKKIDAHPYAEQSKERSYLRNRASQV